MVINKIVNNLSQHKLFFSINIPLILFYLNYIIYGFYGSYTGGSIISQLFITLLIIMIQVYLGNLSSLKKSFFYKQISIDINELLIFLSTFLFISILSKDYLLNTLEGDEFSFLQSSIIHSLKASFIVANKYSFFSDYSFKNIIHFFCVIFFLFNFLLIFYTSKLNPKHRNILFAIILIVFRAIIYFLGGGNNSPHPPLNLLPSFLISSTFGLSGLFLKLGYQLTFAIFLFFLYRLLKNRLNQIFSTLIILFIGTIPVLNRLSTTLTPSLFTFIVFSYLLVQFSLKSEKNYYYLFFIIAVGTMFRIPTLIIVIPTLFLFLKDNFSTIRINKSLFTIGSPLLITLPFLFNTLSVGTPATDFTNSSMSLVEKILFAFETNAIFVAALNSIDLWSLALFPLAFLFGKINSFINLIFLGICIIVYYSIKIEIWGLAKYQVEFIIPFIILGLIYLCFQIKNRLLKYLTYFSITILIIMNIVSGNGYPLNNKNWAKYLDLKGKSISKIKKESAGVIRPVYTISPAYEYVKTNHLGDRLLSLNNDYGILPEIISGFNSKEILKIQQNSLYFEKYFQNKTNKNKSFSKYLLEHPNINVLILSNWNDEKSSLLLELKKNNWVVKKKLINEKHNSITYLLLK